MKKMTIKKMQKINGGRILGTPSVLPSSGNGTSNSTINKNRRGGASSNACLHIILTVIGETFCYK